jgi:hypothetical protein
MARELFVDLTNNRLAASETNPAPAGPIAFVKGDNGEVRLYFLRATGVVNQPFQISDESASSVKFGVGSRTGRPTDGGWTLTFGGDTTTAITYAATAANVQSALNALTAISSAGGVTVSGELESHFTVRFNSAGSRALITGDVTQLIPDTTLEISERIAGSGSVTEVQEIQLRLTPSVYQPTWTDIDTTVTATLATTITGNSTTNEVQRLTFSQEPFSGTYRLTLPANTISVTAATAGVFGTTANHGLRVSQPVTLTGFSALTGYTAGTQYFVQAVAEPTLFTLAITAGGTAISGSATTGSVITISRQTAPLDADASASDVQFALESLDSIGTGNMTVQGIPGEYYDMTFAGSKGYADQPVMTVSHDLQAKNGKVASVNFSTFSLRDLLGNNDSTDLLLEIELTEAGERTTVVQNACTISEELIDSQALAPAINLNQNYAVLTSVVTASNTSTLQPITGMSFSVVTGGQYWMEGYLYFNLTTTSVAGMQFAFSGMTASNVSATAQIGRATLGNPVAAVHSTAISPCIQYTTTSTDTIRAADFNMIFTADTGGTMQFQFAQVTANASFPVTLQPGSVLRLNKVL